MKYLPLPPQQELLDVFEYDEASGWLRYRKTGKRAGSLIPTGYKRVNYKWTEYYQHRLLAELSHGEYANTEHRNAK